MNQYIRIKPLAQMLGVSIPTIYRWAHTDPAFPPLVKVGPGCTVVNLKHAEEFMAWHVEKAYKNQAAELQKNGFELKAEDLRSLHSSP